MKSALPAQAELIQLLAETAGGQATGILTAMRGKLKRLFCFVGGKLVFAASNLIEEQYAEALKQAELLSEEALASASEQAAYRQMKLAAYLIEEGFPPVDQLKAVQRNHVRGLLDSTLEWDKAEFSFDAGQPDLEDELTVSLSCAPIVLEQLQRRPASFELVRGELGPAHLRPRARDDRVEMFDTHELGPVASYLLEHSNGNRELPLLVEASPAAEEKTLRTLYGLLLLGLVETGREAQQSVEETTVTLDECMERLAAAQGADHYMILGLNPSCTVNDVRESYFSMARRLHPDLFRSGPLQELQGNMEEYFSRVTDAYNTLFDPDARADYDRQLIERAGSKKAEPEQDTSHLAKENYARGRMLLNKARFQDAVPFLENAVKLDGSKAIYHLELGRLLIRDPRRRGEAEELLKKANRLDPSIVATLVALGRLYIKMGREQDAERSLREALNWEPDHAEAAAVLAELGPGVGESDRGLLKGLFGGKRGADPRRRR